MKIFKRRHDNKEKRKNLAEEQDPNSVFLIKSVTLPFK